MASLPQSYKVALVTGASRGLGRVLAGFLAKQGYALLTMARDEKPLLAAAKEFAAASVPVVSLPGDVGDAHDRHRLLEAAAAHGKIDLLVNNASDLGDTPLPPLVQASRETFLRVFEVNTLAPLALLTEALPLLRRATGLLVTISSDAATGGYSGRRIYAAISAALDLVSKSLGAALEHQRIGVVGGAPVVANTAQRSPAAVASSSSTRARRARRACPPRDASVRSS